MLTFGVAIGFLPLWGDLEPKVPMSIWRAKRASLKESRVGWQKEHWTWSPKLSVWVPEPPVNNQLNTLGKTLFLLGPRSLNSHTAGWYAVFDSFQVLRTNEVFHGSRCYGFQTSSTSSRSWQASLFSLLDTEGEF